MHLRGGWLALALALAPALCGAQSDPARAAQNPASPGDGQQLSPGVRFEPVAPPPPPPKSGMALILPAKAQGFERAAEITQKGFMAARELDGEKPAVQVIETDGTAAGAIAAYREALAKNVAVIVGPLTKTEVAAVAKEPIAVPTLMLNTPDGAFSPARGLYVLSLSTEFEARVAADRAFQRDGGGAVIVTSTSPLSKRAAAAFAESWTRQGGVVKDTIEFSGNPIKVKKTIDQLRPEMVFLAVDAERARVIRPFLGRNMPVFATSQVYAATPRPDAPHTPDLNGLRFIDIPWLHQPDNAAAMVYPHPQPAVSADLERLYALGIDAFRVALQLSRERSDFEIDGVTGKLVVGGGQIERTPILAEYRDGVAVLREGSGPSGERAALPAATR